MVNDRSPKLLKARVLFDYTARTPSELDLSANEVIFCNNFIYQFLCFSCAFIILIILSVPIMKNFFIQNLYFILITGADC